MNIISKSINDFVYLLIFNTNDFNANALLTSKGNDCYTLTNLTFVKGTETPLALSQIIYSFFNLPRFASIKYLDVIIHGKSFRYYTDTKTSLQEILLGIAKEICI